MKARSVRSLAALAASLLACALALAHEGDLKARDFKGPVVAPAWLADEHVGEEAVSPFRSSGVRLMAWFPVTTFSSANTSGNDVWGYVSASGREYAIMGLSDGTGFVEVTNPGSSRIVAFISGPKSLWRNVKTYRTWAYAVSEGGGGIQVFNLASIDSGVVTLSSTVDASAATPATHTMIVNEQTGYLYRMGGGSNGLRIYSLANPAAPTLVATWNPKYTHDGVVYNYTSGPYAGKEIFFACGGTNGGQTNTGVDILDVTNKASITTIGRFTYTNANFTHQMWLSEDRRYGYINDELDEGNRGVYNLGRIVDLQNLAAPVLAGTYTTGITSIDHNEYVKSNRLFCSNYTTGLQVFDVSNGASPTRVAWFDTHPDDDAAPGATFNGLWSNYPYLPSGTVLGSDIERGLFVWKIGADPATIALPDGETTVFDSRGERVQADVSTAPGISLAAGGVVLHPPVDGVTTDTPMRSQHGRRWVARSPASTCGQDVAWSVEAFVSDGTSMKYPVVGSLPAVSAATYTVIAQDACEVSTGWTVGLAGDTAYAGSWLNVDPNGNEAQPEDDHSAAGTKCWITGNGPPGGAAFSSDVDGGSTTLTSPAYSVATVPDPWVSYWRWYSNNTGTNPNSDSMPVQISGDGGATWVQLELVTENAGRWVQKRFRVRDFVHPTAGTVKLRFIARDQGGDSNVDAGVDDLMVYGFTCPSMAEGDLDQDGSVGAADLAMVLLDFGPCIGCYSDLDGNDEVDAGDVALVLLLMN